VKLLQRIDELMQLATDCFQLHRTFAPYKRNGCRDLAEVVARDPNAAQRVGLDPASMSLDELARAIDQLDLDAMTELLLALGFFERDVD